MTNDAGLFYVAVLCSKPAYLARLDSVLQTGLLRRRFYLTASQLFSFLEAFLMVCWCKTLVGRLRLYLASQGLHKDLRREPRNRFMSRRVVKLVEVDANPLTMLFVPPDGYGID